MMKKLLTLLFMASLLTACQAEQKMLGITGYNYTNRYIDGFSVNGQGGSNVFLSEDDAGGGKTSCCILIRPDTALPVKVHVEWTYGIEGDLRTGKIFRQPETHEADVELKGPIPKDPTIFVVHFYPDNTVQVEVAADYPKPRLKRSELQPKRKP
jgi:hypothetical protein